MTETNYSISEMRFEIRDQLHELSGQPIDVGHNKPILVETYILYTLIRHGFNNFSKE